MQLPTAENYYIFPRKAHFEQKQRDEKKAQER